MWITVRQRFAEFHADLLPTQAQIADALGKAKRVGQALERAYGDEATENPPVFVVGSWGKGTQVRPSADIDIMARFDVSVLRRFAAYAHNGQSALLQEIKDKLEAPFPQTRKRGDGQVVQIDFDSILVELVPAFLMDNGQFIMPDTRQDGGWKTVDPFAQIALIDTIDREHNGNVRALSRMVKRWKHEQSVEVKSFLIELIVVDFVRNCDFGARDFFWYDWLVRDFFKFMRTLVGGDVIIPGTGEHVLLGSDWLPKVETAIGIAEEACDHERDDRSILAGYEWQKIFGNRIPIYIV